MSYTHNINLVCSPLIIFFQNFIHLVKIANLCFFFSDFWYINLHFIRKNSITSIVYCKKKCEIFFHFRYSFLNFFYNKFFFLIKKINTVNIKDKYLIVFHTGSSRDFLNTLFASISFQTVLDPFFKIIIFL